MSSHPHSQNLRSGRYSESGRIYHITSTTENRRPVFSDFRLGRLVVHELRRADHSGSVASLAWVVMPDHFHWLIELKAKPLAQLVKQVKARSALAINHATGSQGRVWQQGFYDRAMRYDEDLIKAARYIVANPLRAGLVTRVGDYSLWDAIWL